MKITALNKELKTIIEFTSFAGINLATNQAIDWALKEDNFFAIYVDGKLNCYSESSDFFQFPKTI
jgi:hypothetical protein